MTITWNKKTLHVLHVKLHNQPILHDFYMLFQYITCKLHVFYMILHGFYMNIFSCFFLLFSVLNPAPKMISSFRRHSLYFAFTTLPPGTRPKAPAHCRESGRAPAPATGRPRLGGRAQDPAGWQRTIGWWRTIVICPLP